MIGMPTLRAQATPRSTVPRPLAPTEDRGLPWRPLLPVVGAVASLVGLVLLSPFAAPLLAFAFLSTADGPAATRTHVGMTARCPPSLVLACAAEAFASRGLAFDRLRDGREVRVVVSPGSTVRVAIRRVGSRTHVEVSRGGVGLVPSGLVAAAIARALRARGVSVASAAPAWVEERLDRDLPPIDDGR